MSAAAAMRLTQLHAPAESFMVCYETPGRVRCLAAMPQLTTLSQLPGT